MLSRELRVPFKPFGPKGTRRFMSFLDHVGTMLGVYGAYVGPMLIHVRLLEAMLVPFSSHVELMFSQERRVPFKLLPGPKGARHFWCRDHVGRIWSLCWAYVDPC